MKSEAAFTELIGFYGDASWVDPRKTQFRGGCQMPAAGACYLLFELLCVLLVLHSAA
jgi:hypothetical protein